MKHLRENNESYLSHLVFAVGVGLSLIVRAVFFLAHGVFPFIQIPTSLNLMATRDKIEEWCRYADRRKRP
jgi:hypothetical protein